MHSSDRNEAPLTCLVAFTEAVVVMRLLREKEAEIRLPAQLLFSYLRANLLNTAAVEWCKVFGSTRDDTHWTKAVPKAHHSQTRAAITAATGLNVTEWATYRQDIISYRDQVAAHHDLRMRRKRYPDFTPALQAAEAVYAELQPLAPTARVPASLPRARQRMRGRYELAIAHALSGRALKA